MKRRDAIKNVVLTSAFGTIGQMLPKNLVAGETQKQNNTLKGESIVEKKERWHIIDNQ
jgi:hypothetical protein